MQCLTYDQLYRLEMANLENHEEACQHVEACPDCSARLESMPEPVEEFRREFEVQLRAAAERLRSRNSAPK